MTSTSFNVGVGSEAKNSSRVLRPPGGGHTDIFGLKEPLAPAPRKEDNRRNASSILEGKNIESPPETRIVKEQQNGASQNGKAESPKEQPKMVNVKEQSCVQPQDNGQQKRARVPPGGFSSGLW